MSCQRLPRHAHHHHIHRRIQQGEGAGEGGQKGHYVGVHASGFKDFLLKAELLRALVDCGFEHPSEGKTSWGDATKTTAA